MYDNWLQYGALGVLAMCLLLGFRVIDVFVKMFVKNALDWMQRLVAGVEAIPISMGVIESRNAERHSQIVLAMQAHGDQLGRVRDRVTAIETDIDEMRCHAVDPPARASPPQDVAPEKK